MTDVTDTTRLVRTQGVTAPAGFRATGIAAGIKASGALDLALVFNEGPDHGAAGVFTRNKVKAAPVLWSQQVLTTGALRAVILNSGGANACTGPQGFQDTHTTAAAVAAALSDSGTETSTIDTVLLLAWGASEIAPSQTELDDAVLQVCDDLCAQLQADAEGVTKRIVVTVTGAASEADALTAARVVARDSLVKTALFGSDANWGRVLAAVGMAPVTLDAERISVSFNGSPVCIDSVGAPGARDVDLSGAHIDVTLDLGVGAERASIHTTDLLHAHVEENSAYSS